MENIVDKVSQQPDDAPESMQVDKTSERRTLRRRKEKVHKLLKRRVNEKEMDSFTKLIYHGFYKLLTMAYRCFKIYLLRYRVYLECLQVHGRFGGNC